MVITINEIAKPQPPTMREVIEKYMLEISPTQKGHSRNTEIADHWYDFLDNFYVKKARPFSSA